MYTNKTKVLIQYLLINVFLITFILGFYISFSSKFENDYRNNYISNFQTLIETKLDEKLVDDYDTFENITTNKTIVELNDDIRNENISKQTPYKVFLEVKNNSFTYQNKVYYIDQNPLINNNFGFFDDNFYFIKEDVVGVLNSDEYFSQIFTLSDALNGFIMDNKGEIYFNSNKDFKNNVLHNYLNIDSTDLFLEHFSRNEESVSVNTKLDNEKVIFRFTTLKNFEDLYIAQHFKVTNITAYSKHYTTFVLILLISYSAISISLLGLIFYYLNNKNNDIETKRLLYFYNKPLILFIKRNGQIKKANKSFLDKSNKVKHLSELVTNYSDNTTLKQVERGAIIKLNLDLEVYTFVPLKVRGGYYLIARTDFGNEIDPNLERLAYINPATNYQNFYKLNNDLNNLHNELITNKRSEFTIISFDIKGFKHINKKLKRDTADLVLMKASEIINNVVSDFNYQFNLYTEADIFNVLVYDKKGKDIEKIVKKVLETFKKPLEIERNKMTLTFTTAVIEVNNNETDILKPKEIIRHLEETIKRAKDLPNIDYLVYDETIKHYVTFRTNMEKDLIKGLENDEFTVFLQAKYNYNTDKIVGFESLVRWDNPNYIKVSPLEYVTLAEENGLIVELGNVIKIKTFEAAKKLEKYNMRVSMNISPVEIMQQGFIDDFLSEYKKYGFRDNTIILEVTETAIIESLSVVNEKLEILQKNGILIHLDDFGTGYSTLPYIKDLRFDAIKIDKMYIDYIDTDSYSKAIVNMIISLAKTLNLQVISEGVEHERQMKELAKLGCHLIQGYLISEPIRLEEAIQLIEDYNIKDIKGFKGGKRK